MCLFLRTATIHLDFSEGLDFALDWKNSYSAILGKVLFCISPELNFVHSYFSLREGNGPRCRPYGEPGDQHGKPQHQQDFVPVTSVTHTLARYLK